MNVLEGLLIAFGVASLASIGFVIGMYLAAVVNDRRRGYTLVDVFDDEDQDAIG